MHNSQAILLLAYGSPDTQDDIEAYYTDIRHGHPPDAAQLKELQNRYAAIGGKTPLLEITHKQSKLLEERLSTKTYIGMKHWHPYIPDAVKQIADSGAKQIVAIVLAPHYSMMSIGDYKARLHHAIEEVDPTIQVSLIKQWGDNQVFIDSLCERIETTRKSFPHPDWDDIEVVFTAHSLPMKILEMNDPYQKELLQTSTLAAAKLNLPHWRLSFQSAGRTRDTWLGPDILQELQTIKKEGGKQVLVAPIGFTTDNLEILYDLDIQAAESAKEQGITFKRIPSANVTPRFIAALQDVIEPYLYQEHILVGVNPEK
ncbi:MAG TPA: ferrochelatase [Candidatus Acidoferrales bacterium]|nr:ferrochelatase [Candidatus Acidoferrales bacterium]